MSSSFFHVFDNDIKKVTVSAATKSALRTNCLEMMTFSVGGGEAILLRRKKQVILIDGGAGERPENLPLGEFLAQYLAGNELKLAAFIATHPHVDHLNALLPLLHKTGTALLDTGATYYDNGEEYPNALKNTLIAYLNSASAGLSWVHVTQSGKSSIFASDVKLKLFVNGSKRPTPAYKSVYMAVQFGEARLLFTGDSYVAYENDLILSEHKSALEAQVLKVTHHGSKGGTGANFVEQVKPRIAIASTSRETDHTLKQEVRDRLTKTRPCQIFDTFTSGGDIIVRTDGKSRTIGGNDGVLYEVQTVVPGLYQPA